MKTRNQQDYLVKVLPNKIPHQQVALDNQHKHQQQVVLDNRQLRVCLNQTQDYLVQLSLLIQEQEDLVHQRSQEIVEVVYLEVPKSQQVVCLEEANNHQQHPLINLLPPL